MKPVKNNLRSKTTNLVYKGNGSRIKPTSFESTDTSILRYLRRKEMKRSKGIFGGLVCLLLATVLVLGLVFPTAAAAESVAVTEESEEASDQPVLSLAEDEGLQALADMNCVAGNTYNLSGTIRTYDGTKEITFSSSNSSRASISSLKMSSQLIGSLGTFAYSVDFIALKAGDVTIRGISDNGTVYVSQTVSITVPDATSVSLSKSTLEIAKGESATLTATVNPSGASQSVTWSTSDSKIATVSGGKVTGVSVGTATITAKTSNGKTASCTVKVSGSLPASVSLSKSTLSLTKGNSSTLTATVKPSDGPQSVTWSSSNTKVATVSGGKVTAVGAGTATITAKTSNGKTATCKVTVTIPSASSVSLNKSTLKITRGNTSNLTATVKPSGASQSVTWSTSNSKVATVSGGKVTGAGVGTATITAKTSNGKTATCKVTVTGSITKDATLIPVYRLYSPITGEHLYTSDYNEYQTLYKNYGWGDEGVGWYAPTEGTAVYRLYQPEQMNHLYTTDATEVKVLTSKYGWQKDNNGKPLYYSGGSVKIYRVYNKDLNGMHHLTTDLNEYKTLPKYGWSQEGTKLFASALGESITTRYYKK